MASVAVIMPVYNSESSVGNSIRSVLAQTWVDWELIIVNDGSTDNTENRISEFGDKRITLLSFEINRGRAAARQLALKHVLRGDYEFMCMLDSDDVYLVDKLEYQVSFMRANKDVSLMSTALGICDERGIVYRVYSPVIKQKNFFYDSYENYTVVPHASSVIRVSDIPRSIGFRENQFYGEDQDFLRRLLLGKNYVCSPKITYLYNRDASFSISKYIRSAYFQFISTYRLPITNVYKFREFILLCIKSVGVIFLNMIGLAHIYFNIMGREITSKELEEIQRNRIE